MFVLLWALSGLGNLKSPPLAADKIRVVYYLYPPHIFIGPNGLTGSSYEVWRRVAKRAGVEIEWIGPVPFQRAQFMVEKGEADAIFRLTKTPEREAKFIFNRTAPFWAHQGIVVLKSEPLDRIRSAQDLYGKSIGKFAGGIEPPFTHGHGDKIYWDPVPADAAELNMVKLFRKRIWGVYFVFADVAQYWAAKENRAGEIKVLSYPGSAGFQKAYMPYSRKAPPGLIQKMERAIDIEVGTYDYVKITQKYITAVVQENAKAKKVP